MSPVFDRTVELGLAAVSVYNHMWLPTSYGDAEAEYRRLTEAVAIWDVAAQRHVEISGADAEAFVDRCTMVDARRLEPGHGTYAPLVDHDGILVNDPVLFRTPDDRWRFSIADSDVGLWFDALAHAEAHRVEVRELPTATIAVQGPNAPAVADRLDLALDQLAEKQHEPGRIGDVEVVCSRSGWSSQPGFEVFVDEPDRAPEVWDAIWAAGEGLGIGPGAPNQAERIESGLLSYGTDTGYHADPFELGIGDLAELDTDDFIGRDALRRIRADGPRRRLVGCSISGPRIEQFRRPIPLGGDADPADTLEQLRIAVHSPARGENVGLCLVAVERDLDADERVAFPDGERTLRFTEFPFPD